MLEQPFDNGIYKAKQPSVFVIKNANDQSIVGVMKKAGNIHVRNYYNGYRPGIRDSSETNDLKKTILAELREYSTSKQ